MVVADEKLSRAISFLGELILPTGQPLGDSFITDPSLLRVAEACLASAPDGTPSNKFTWHEALKGHGKSTLLGGLVLTDAALNPGSEGLLLAGDREQAMLPLQAMTALISRSPALKNAVSITRDRFTLANGSFVKIMSADAATLHGIGISRRLSIFCDEFGNWPESLEALYHVILASIGKMSNSGLRISTNAGLSDSWQFTAKETLEAAGASMIVSTERPSWVSEESIEAMRAVLPPPVFSRYYLGKWISGVAGQAVSPEDWDGCRTDIPALTPTTDLVLGVDAGIISDAFAIIGVSRTSGEGKRELVTSDTYGLSLFVPRETEAPKIAVRATKIWTPHGQPLDFGEPYQFLAGFVRSHRVRCITYDPSQLHDFMVRFQREHSIWTESFDQTSRRAVADVDLLALIRSRRLEHDGNEELRAHVLNASLKMQAREDSRGRFVKSKSSRKIDALVALSMASSQAMYLNLS